MIGYSRAGSGPPPPDPQTAGVTNPVGTMQICGFVPAPVTLLHGAGPGCRRRRRPRPGDKWHLDEVFIRIEGVRHYLWRAVDQDGVVLDILIQARRDGEAAKRFFKRLLKGLGMFGG